MFFFFTFCIEALISMILSASEVAFKNMHVYFVYIFVENQSVTLLANDTRSILRSKHTYTRIYVIRWSLFINFLLLFLLLAQHLPALCIEPLNLHNIISSLIIARVLLCFFFLRVFRRVFFFNNIYARTCPITVYNVVIFVFIVLGRVRIVAVECSL